MEMKPITIVGCGPGAPDQVTPAARHAVEQAQVLLGAGRLIGMFPHVAAERIVVGANVPQVLAAIAGRLGERRRIVVLVTGDPGLCSLAQPVIQRFGRAACRVIPGISSVHAAFASLGIDWLGARILSAHNTAPALDPAGLGAEGKLAVLAGNPATAWWVEALACALLPTHDIYLCENLTLADESVRQLEVIPAPMNPASRSILILIRKEVR